MNESDPFIESLHLKVKSRQEIADEYGISEKTLIRRLKKVGIILPPGNVFPGICKEIYNKLGIPAKLSEKSKDNNRKIVPDK